MVAPYLTRLPPQNPKLDLTEDLAVYRALIEHIASFWPQQRSDLLRWDVGPIRQHVPRFVVCQVAPEPGEREWAYVSLGAWEASRAKPCAHEFVIVAPDQDPIHVESLAMAT